MHMLIALPIFAAILGLLAALAVYDYKYYILPDRLNAALALACILFHLANKWVLLSPTDSLLGAVAGGGLLLIIRTLAIRFYNEDALGLGDVKLMTAAGFGLGFPYVMLALSLGALLGLFHGLVMGLAEKRAGRSVDFGRINVPAGLGLAGGIAIVLLWMTFPLIQAR